MRRRPSRRSVARLAKKGDLDGLAKVLSARDLVPGREGVLIDFAVPTRVHAVEVLAHVRDDRATALAADGLEDPDSRVRLAAVRTLAVTDPQGEYDERLATALARWRADVDAPERIAALEVLTGRSSPEQATRFVKALLSAEPRDPVSAADQQAITALVADHGPALEPLCVRLAGDLAEEPRAGDVLIAIGEDAVEALVSALRGPGARSAIAALAELRDSSAVEPLTGVITDANPELRAAAAQALGAIRDPQAAEALVRASLDPDPAVRDAAHGALERLGTSGVLAGFAAFVGPLIGRIEQLEAAQREPAQLPAPSDGVTRPALQSLRRVLRR